MTLSRRMIWDLKTMGFQKIPKVPLRLVKDVLKTATAGNSEFLTLDVSEAASAEATETEPFVSTLVWLEGPFVPAATADLAVCTEACQKQAYLSGGLTKTHLDTCGEWNLHYTRLEE